MALGVSFGITKQKVSVDTDFWSNLLKALPAAIWAGIGWFLATLWATYRSRVSKLGYVITHQSLAVAQQNDFVGTIEVLYNGYPADNVYLTTLRVSNQTSKDFSNLELNLQYRDGSNVKVAAGTASGSLNYLLFTDSFNRSVDRLLEMAEDDPNRNALLAFLTTRRDFQIPVLNRGQWLDIYLIVQAPAGQQPVLDIATDYPGLSLTTQPQRPQFYGVDQHVAVILGLFIGAVVLFLIAPRFANPFSLAFTAFAIAAFSSLIGVAVVKVFRLISKVFE